MKRKRIVNTVILVALCGSFFSALAWDSDSDFEDRRYVSPQLSPLARRRNHRERMSPQRMTEERFSQSDDVMVFTDDDCCCVPPCISVPTCVGCCFTGFIMGIAALSTKTMSAE